MKPRNYHRNVVGGVATGEEEQEIQRQKRRGTVIISVSFYSLPVANLANEK